MTQPSPALATTLSNVVAAIHRFPREVATSVELANRLAFARAWYAVRSDHGSWIFGPSKFIGYDDLDAETYLSWSNRLDGRRTEAQLRKWFVPSDLSSPTHAELTNALSTFLSRFGKAPSTMMRINVLPELLDEAEDTSTALLDLIVGVAKTLKPADVRLLSRRLESMSAPSDR
ncbi:MAG: hypothetical protein OXP28_05650 [Gammaproteobacteria bacterium]|nr:hypothetical protein [Gammaproteobacteria bacterium]